MSDTAGTKTIWYKGVLNSDNDFCSACTDWDTGDFMTTPETATGAGLSVQIVGNSAQDYETASSDFDTLSYITTTVTDGVKIHISDGSNIVVQTLDSVGLNDGTWHSVVIVSQDTVSDFCSACTDFSDDYNQVSGPVITVYVDKVSIGTIDHSSIVGDLSNSETAFIGVQDTSFTYPMVGTLALFEYQNTNWSTTDVDSYHDDARIRVNDQKVAFHFTGNDSGETGLEAIIG